MSDLSVMAPCLHCGGHGNDLIASPSYARCAACAGEGVVPVCLSPGRPCERCGRPDVQCVNGWTSAEPDAARPGEFVRVIHYCGID